MTNLPMTSAPSGARRRRWALAPAAAAALLLAGCSVGTNAVDQTAGSQFRFTNATPAGNVIPVADRQKPGKVSGTLLNGGTYTLAQDAGKVVVVNIWGSWCGPCQVETPEFQQVYLQTRAQGVDFVGFAIKETSPDNTRSFVTDHAITYPIVYDPMSKIALELGNLPISAGVPQTVLIDRQGRVAASYVGQVRPSKLKPAIAQLTAES